MTEMHARYPLTAASVLVLAVLAAAPAAGHQAHGGAADVHIVAPEANETYAPGDVPLQLDVEQFQLEETPGQFTNQTEGMAANATPVGHIHLMLFTHEEYLNLTDHAANASEAGPLTPQMLEAGGTPFVVENGTVDADRLLGTNNVAMAVSENLTLVNVPARDTHYHVWAELATPAHQPVSAEAADVTPFVVTEEEVAEEPAEEPVEDEPEVGEPAEEAQPAEAEPGEEDVPVSGAVAVLALAAAALAALRRGRRRG